MSNDFFGFGVEFFFSITKREKNFSTKKRNYCVLSRCACAKLIFLSVEIFLKWTPAFRVVFGVKISICIVNGQLTMVI